jgi:hypothetical protein
MFVLAILGNGLVAAVTFAIWGWNIEGAHAAARHTARFSMLWFAVGFAAPGLARFVRYLPAQATLIQSFVAAHFVHFASVAILLARFGRAQITHHPGAAAASILGGFVVIAATGLTAAPRASRPYTAVHSILLYSVFSIFFLVFVHHPVKPLRLFAVLLGLALFLRLTRGRSFDSARTRTAG